MLPKEPYTLHFTHGGAATCHKEPYILPNNPSSLPKESCILPKEPYMLPKDPYILSKESYILLQEPDILPKGRPVSKDSCMLVKEPYPLTKDLYSTKRAQYSITRASCEPFLLPARWLGFAKKALCSTNRVLHALRLAGKT